MMASRILLRQCLPSFSISSLIIPSSVNASQAVRMIPKASDLSRIVVARNFADVVGGNLEVEEGMSSTQSAKIPERERNKDRTRVIPVETSIRYLDSPAYAQTYGGDAVWVKYRRNFKGAWAPPTRKTCIRQNKISTGTPCPICRDEYLVLDYRNVKLLQQFISPYNGATLPTMKTGLCRRRQRELHIAIAKAKDYGLISFDVPLRDYDYSDYQTAKE